MKFTMVFKNVRLESALGAWCLVLGKVEFMKSLYLRDLDSVFV